MNYNSLLDGFFGNNWLAYGLLPVYLVLVLAFHKRIMSGKKKTLIKAVVYFALPLLWLITVGSINPVYWGYGKPKGITALYVANGKLLVQDYVLTAGGKMSRGTPYSRIHVIDPVSGEGLLRFPVGEGKGDIVGVRGDTLAYATAEEVQFFSVSSGALLYRWNAETLPVLFPELASGVNQFSAYQTGNDLRVSSMDGNRWVLDILHNGISPDDNSTAEKVPTGKLMLANGALCTDSKAGDPEELIRIDYKSGSGEQQTLYTAGDSVLNPALTFLGGQIVAFSTADSCFTVMHYTTAAHTHVVFTGVSWDGKQLWSIAQTQLRPGDAENEEQAVVLTVPDEQNRLLIVCFQTEVIALSLTAGTVQWRKIP